MAINYDHGTNSISSTTGYLQLTSKNQIGWKNRIINGAMTVFQRGTTALTVTAGTTVPTVSTGYYNLDRWFIYSLGGNPTVAPIFSNTYVMQITGVAGITEIGVGQRIEAVNMYDLAGQTVTLSWYMSNSVLTTVNVTLSYPTISDTAGPIGTPTKTQIATTPITITSTLSRYAVIFNVPAAATTGLEVLFTVGAQTSGTWNITLVQLEVGSGATAFEFRPQGTEFSLCQRYLEQVPNQGVRGCGYAATAGLTTNYFTSPLQVQKRVAPSSPVTFSISNLTSVAMGTSAYSLVFAFTATAVGNFFWYTNAAAAMTLVNAEL